MNLFLEDDDPRNDVSAERKVGDNNDANGEEGRSSDHRINSDGNANLQDSEYTVDSLTNEPIPGTGWLGGIGTDFLHCLTENVTPVVSGVATLVQKTAVAVANEISQLERDGELRAAAAAAAAEAAERSKENRGREEAELMESNGTMPDSSFDSSGRKKSEDLILPWEVCQESSHNSTVEEDDDKIIVYFTDAELMKRIFALSREDSTFLQPYTSSDDVESQKKLSSPSRWRFVMDEPRVKLINRILDIDENLASVHFRLTGGDSNLSETLFWKNYFFHCEKVRTDEFCRRKTQDETANTETQPSSESKVAGVNDKLSIDENANMEASQHLDDEESLIPVGSDTEWEQDDTSSYVIQSAPNTADTFATTRSIDDDMVLVDTHEHFSLKNSPNRRT